MDNRKTAFLLFLILLIDAWSSGLLIPIAMQLLALGNGNNVSMSLQDFLAGSTLVIAVSPAYFVFAPIMGHYSDVFGRKKALIFCISLSTIGYSAILLGYCLASITVILFGMLLFNIGASSLPVTQAAMADIGTGATRARYFGLLMIAMLAMLIAGQFSLALLNKHVITLLQNWNPLWIAVVSELFCLFLIVLCLPETKAVMTSKPYASLSKFLLSLMVTFRNQPVRWLLLILFLIELAWGFNFQNEFNLLTKVFNCSIAQANQFLVFEGLIMMLGLATLYPWLAKRYPPLKLLIYILSCVGLFGLFWLSSNYMPAKWLANVLLSVATAMLTPLLWWLLADATKPKHMGLVMGIAGPTWSLGWIISGLVTSPLATLNFRLPMLLAIIIMVGIIIIIWRCRAFSHSAKL